MYDTTGMRQVGNLWELSEDLHGSPYYNDDLAPTTTAKRTWNTWHIAALWIGMAVCVPTYMLAAGMIKDGMTWWQAILTVFLGNLIVLVPMVLNAHAGTKYGIPFPVLLRAPFGVWGSNIAALMRAFVACGWFGIQTWFGGLAFYQLGCAFFPKWAEAKNLTLLIDIPPATLAGGYTLNLGLNGWQACCFILFWLINVWIIVRGINSIKWLESLSAPLLLIVGVVLLVWASQAVGLRSALARSEGFGGAAISVGAPPAYEQIKVSLRPVRDGNEWRPKEYRLALSDKSLATAEWKALPTADTQGEAVVTYPLPGAGNRAGACVFGQFRSGDHVSTVQSTPIPMSPGEAPRKRGFLAIFWPWLTGMIAFWATLSLNIPDFSRYARSQKAQALGQFIGLPPTMALYSFIGIAVTCAAVWAFKDILVTGDAPWDPATLLGRFTKKETSETLFAWWEHPRDWSLFVAWLKASWVVIISMLSLMIATLTTNVAANVVSPANDFSNLSPTKISFRMGALITALLGVVMVPWKVLETTHGYIFTWLIGYSALLGPIGGIMIADYYVVRRAQLRLPDLYKRYGIYRYCGGTSLLSLFVLVVAILPNVPGFLITSGFWSEAGFANLLKNIAWGFNSHADMAPLAGRLVGLYDVAWITGFGVAFVLYTLFGLIVRKV
ncbi:MAG: NCS1 family nucleobase:cation symporter-1 [Planctomycetota bacterium]